MVKKTKTYKNKQYSNSDTTVISKSISKKNYLAEKYNLPDYVYDGSCLPPEEGTPHYYKLAEDSEGKKQKELISEPLVTAAGTNTRQLAASYWKLLLGPTQFIYWDPSAKNNRNTVCNDKTKQGKWIFIDKARDILEGESPPTQCNNVIGNNSYLNTDEYKNWFNNVFNKTPPNYNNLYDFFAREKNGFVKFRKTCCWICGFPLYPEGINNSTKPPCEHILPVVNAIFNLKLYQKEDNSFTRIHQSLLNKYPDQNPLNSFDINFIRKLPADDTNFPPASYTTDYTKAEDRKQNYIDHIPQLNQLLKEYAWSHTCCNAIKDDYNLITTRKNKNNIYEIIPNQQQVTVLLNEIWGNCFNENINALNQYYNKTGFSIPTVKQNSKNLNDWLEARITNMMNEFLQPICDYSNKTYSDVPLLYNLASIASIVNTVPKELRNLLLFSTISEDKLDKQDVIEYISLSDNESILDTQLTFIPNYEENANIVYLVANKIATVIQNETNTNVNPVRQTRNIKSTPESAETYSSFLNTLFQTSDFTTIIDNNEINQKKTNIPKYNKIIAEFLYKISTPDIYNFYKLMFVFLLESSFNQEQSAKLSTMSYYVLQYHIMLFILNNFEFNPNNTALLTKSGISNLLKKIKDICNEFYLKEIKNINNFLNNLARENMIDCSLKFNSYFSGLWPLNINNDILKTPNFPIPKGIKISSTTVFNTDEKNKTLAFKKFTEILKTIPSNKIKTNVSPSDISDIARSFEQNEISSNTTNEYNDAIQEITNETGEFQNKLDLLINYLEEYDKYPEYKENIVPLQSNIIKDEIIQQQENIAKDERINETKIRQKLERDCLINQKRGIISPMCTKILSRQRIQGGKNTHKKRKITKRRTCKRKRR